MVIYLFYLVIYLKELAQVQVNKNAFDTKVNGHLNAVFKS